MSPKQWLALFCFYISYLFFGASVFYHIEHELEATQRAYDLQHRIDINEILVKYTSPDDLQVQDEILRRVSTYCGKKVTNYTEDPFIEPLKWSFYHAFFFSFTVCSTVGYGNISPTNTVSRMFMIFYALIGIPVNGFLFAYLGDFFGKVFLSAYDRYKKFKMARTKNYVPQKLGLIAQIILYLIPGVVVFLFLPSLIFSYFESWDYTVSIYYSFVTLTTIGFGDFVPTFQPEQEKSYGIMFHIYEVFIIFWFIFGLGYLVMIMGFIAKGLRSKHLTRLEHQLADNIRATQSRIWNGVTKDVGYLRRILNEVYLMKFKPVYTEDDSDAYSTGRRSSSCPDLAIYRPASDPTHRRRAQSLYYPDNGADLLSSATIHRVQSDSELSKIDKERTFDPLDQLSPPGQLLARVVTALGSIRALEDDNQSILDAAHGGMNIFTDSQILASERAGSRLSLARSEGNYSVAPTKKRARAASEFQPPPSDKLYGINDDVHKWTWSGNNDQIQEFLRQRKMEKRKSKDLYRTALGGATKHSPSIVVNIEPPAEAFSPALSTPNSLLNRLNPFRRRTQSDDKTASMATTNENYLDVATYLNRDSAGRQSRASLAPSQYLNDMKPRRDSNFSIMSFTDDNNADVLERTTIADLIRALEVVHTQANVPQAPLLQEFFDTPKRKIGTAGFMPTGHGQNHTQMQTSTPLPMINICPPSSENVIRRNSLRLLSTEAQLFNRLNMSRRPSNILDNIPSARRSSLLHPSVTNPSGQPPPYSETTPRIINRRFSVRPTCLSIPPGQAPLPLSKTTLQRRLSARPSPLTLDSTNAPRPHGRYGRSISIGSESGDTPVMKRKNLHFRPTLNEPSNRSRRNSRTQVFEPNKNRRRSDSK